MKAVVAAFNQEKALVGAFSVITNVRMQFGCNFLKVSTVGGLVTVPALCTVGAVFTFGLSCALGLAVTGISAGLCSGLPELSDQGETI